MTIMTFEELKKIGTPLSRTALKSIIGGSAYSTVVCNSNNGESGLVQVSGPMTFDEAIEYGNEKCKYGIASVSCAGNDC
jgi:hypothetical protein